MFYAYQNKKGKAERAINRGKSKFKMAFSTAATNIHSPDVSGKWKNKIIKMMKKYDETSEKEILDTITQDDCKLYKISELSTANDTVKEFERMKKQGIIPSLLTYSILINKLGKASQFWAMEQYVEEMVVKDIKPNLFI